MRLSSGDPLRLIGTVAVVYLHAAAGGVYAYHSIPAALWWFCNALDASCRWCVPVFVMLSGALLLGKDEPASVFFGKRAARIAVPLLFWSVFYVLWGAFYVADVAPNPVALVKPFVEGVAQASPWYHLHFLFIIGGLYLVTPFLRVFCLHASGSQLRLFLAMAFVLSAIDGFVTSWKGGNPTAASHFLPFVGYYVAGYCLRHICLTPAQRFALWGALLSSVSVTTFAMGYTVERWGLAGLGVYPYHSLSPLVIVMAFCVFAIVTDAFDKRDAPGWVGQIARATFGAYLIHPAVLNVLGRHGFSVPPSTRWEDVILSGCLSLAISLIITLALLRVPVLRRLVA